MIDGGLYKSFKKHLPQVHWQRVETGGISEGVPDVNACYEGIEFWIEFKRERNGRVALRPTQIGWITERLRYGGLIRIAVRLDDQLVLYDGKVVRELRAQLAVPHLGRWLGEPNYWNWKEILQLLITRHA